MRIHILGICGTFMAGIALLAKQLGHDVSGADQNIYPPMSDVLANAGIELIDGYAAEQFAKLPYGEPDVVIMGNAMTRGKPAVEYVLDSGLHYISGPQWLYENVLRDKWVLAVAGTHGKTTTTSMLTWILQQAGLEPGYLIGGVANGFAQTASVGNSKYFVIEADEYDSAFFDKRSKFIHYHPRTLILNNLEFDHADIFDDLAAIEKQFHFLIRTVSSSGLILAPSVAEDKNIARVLQRGCWSPLQTMGFAEAANWQAVKLVDDGSEFEIKNNINPAESARIKWALLGEHNVKNALAAVAAANHVGVSVADACKALQTFPGVKRRLEVRGKLNGAIVYDDFAHHPTAIRSTLAGLRQHINNGNGNGNGNEKGRIIVALEFASYTMRHGTHAAAMADALRDADEILFYQANTEFDVSDVVERCQQAVQVYSNVGELAGKLKKLARDAERNGNGVGNDHIVIMSNRDFGGIFGVLGV